LGLPSRLFRPFRSRNLDENDLLPDSLLIRIAWRSLLVAIGHAMISGTGTTLMDPVIVNDAAGSIPPVVLDKIVATNAGFAPGNDSASRMLKHTIGALIDLESSTDSELELSFRAVLDTASHRVDPWITGIATRRLAELRNAGTKSSAGIYGWVDGPLLGV